MSIRPILQSLLVADHVYVDASTGKKIIAGTFNRVTAREFPSQMMVSKSALISLTGVHGEVELSLRYVDLSTGETLVEMRGLSIGSSDPLETVEMVVEIPPLPMPHPGAYALEAHWEGEMLGGLRIYVDSHDQDTAPDE